MKKMFITLFMAAGISTPALAEDTSWTGPYLGVNAGLGTGTSNMQTTLGGGWISQETSNLRTAVINGTSHHHTIGGPSYGVQAGYNYQLNSNVVAGLEGEFTVLNQNDPLSNTITYNPSLSYAVTSNIQTKNMIALRAKLGYAIGKTLLYATAGGAWVKADYTTSITSSGNYLKAGALSKRTSGWIAGAGVERKFWDKASVRFDYSYTRQSHATFSNAYLPGSSFTSPVYSETYNQRVELHQFRVGVNYHF